MLYDTQRHLGIIRLRVTQDYFEYHPAHKEGEIFTRNDEVRVLSNTRTLSLSFIFPSLLDQVFAFHFLHVSQRITPSQAGPLCTSLEYQEHWFV